MLLVAAAGVGGVLVAGLELGSLGQLTFQQGPRIVVALIGLVVALAGVGAVIARAAALLTEDWVSLLDLGSEDAQQKINELLLKRADKQSGSKRKRRRRAGDPAAIYESVRDHGEELYRGLAETLEGLWGELVTANRLSRVRAAAGWVASDATTSHDRELRLAVQTVVEFATYQRTRANFAALQKVLFWSSGAVVVGVTIFAIATHSPSKPASQAHPRRTHTYTVQYGDTLWDIADWIYGDGSQYPRIAKASGITDPDRIEPGETLTIPP